MHNCDIFMWHKPKSNLTMESQVITLSFLYDFHSMSKSKITLVTVFYFSKTLFFFNNRDWSANHPSNCSKMRYTNNYPLETVAIKLATAGIDVSFCKKIIPDQERKKDACMIKNNAETVTKMPFFICSESFYILYAFFL